MDVKATSSDEPLQEQESTKDENKKNIWSSLSSLKMDELNEDKNIDMRRSSIQSCHSCL